ncbi:MAG: hypothetical protein CL431_03995 [Acidimicrobiaceae bacterium]|nr:hypothetical protein [Acidimicrobiaceae bacterium]
MIPSVRKYLTISLLLLFITPACGQRSQVGQSETPSPAVSQSADLDKETVIGEIGNPGVGDRYFPMLGNGGYDVTEYDLQLTWDPNLRFLSGSATIYGTSNINLLSLNLDLSGMKVLSVSMDDANLQFFVEENELTVVFPSVLIKNTDFSITVDYEGTPGLINDSLFPFEGGWFNSARGVLVAGEPSSSQAWHPVNDHPKDRAHFNISMTLPSDLSFVTNGVLVSKSSDAKSTTWEYETEHEQAPYLTTIAIGKFSQTFEQTFDEIQIRHWVEEGVQFPSQENLNLETMIIIFEELFGPYPFGDYGILAVNENLGYALETQTLSIFGKDLVGNQQIQAHELAHQWFGNFITLDDWSDIWLNEGLATYAEQLYLEKVNPNYNIDESFFEYYYSLSDQGYEFHVKPRPGDPGPTALFSSSVYIRPAMALHALRLEMGDPLFFQSLREYVRTFGGKSATPEGFIETFEDNANKDLELFFQQWLFEDQLPPR